MQYYLLGRQALLHVQVPVCANLLHHALEMLIKAALRPTYTSTQLRKTFGHKLGGLWAEYKAVICDGTLSRFDASVTLLDKWEEIRYPPDAGFSAQITTDRIDRSLRRRLPNYVLSLDEIDELVAIILEKSGWAKRFHHVLRDRGRRAMYFEQNRHTVFRRSSFRAEDDELTRKLTALTTKRARSKSKSGS
jgi:hypothetical protein